ncbi:MAG: hypothetical protein AAFR96_03045 [Planctomycetota bacterium]
MRVLLDGKEIEASEPTVASAIEAGRAAAEGAGRAIIEVVVNGEPLQGAGLDEPSPEPIEGGEVRLTSADPSLLVRATLLDAADALDATRAQHSAIAEGLQSGETAGALQELSSTLQVWQAAQDVLTRGWLLLGRDTATLDAPQASGADSIDAMVEQLAGDLQEIKRALGDQDLAAVADVVGYDLEPRAEHWVTLLRDAAARTLPDAPGEKG